MFTSATADWASAAAERAASRRVKVEFLLDPRCRSCLARSRTSRHTLGSLPYRRSICAPSTCRAHPMAWHKRILYWKLCMVRVSPRQHEGAQIYPPLNDLQIVLPDHPPASGARRSTRTRHHTTAGLWRVGARGSSSSEEAERKCTWPSQVRELPKEIQAVWPRLQTLAWPRFRFSTAF